jgi:hypothetical protein
MPEPNLPLDLSSSRKESRVVSDLDLALHLSTDRAKSGVLIVRERSTGKELRRYQALGRGSAGGGDTQMVTNGNTPVGEYEVVRIKGTSGWPQDSYGPNGALELKPKSGKARDAETLVNRSGLLIHGGSLTVAGTKSAAVRGGAGRLKPTLGCVRLGNAEMKDLVALIDGARNDVVNGVSRNVTVTLRVADFPASVNYPALR